MGGRSFSSCVAVMVWNAGQKGKKRASARSSGGHLSKLVQYRVETNCALARPRALTAEGRVVHGRLGRGC